MVDAHENLPIGTEVLSKSYPISKFLNGWEPKKGIVLGRHRNMYIVYFPHCGHGEGHDGYGFVDPIHKKNHGCWWVHTNDLSVIQDPEVFIDEEYSEVFI